MSSNWPHPTGHLQLCWKMVKSSHGAAPIQVANLVACKNVYVPIQRDPGSAGGWVDGSRSGHLLKGSTSFTCGWKLVLSHGAAVDQPKLEQKDSSPENLSVKPELLKNLRFTWWKFNIIFLLGSWGLIPYAPYILLLPTMNGWNLCFFCR